MTGNKIILEDFRTNKLVSNLNWSVLTGKDRTDLQVLNGFFAGLYG